VFHILLFSIFEHMQHSFSRPRHEKEIQNNFSVNTIYFIIKSSQATQLYITKVFL